MKHKGGLPPGFRKPTPEQRKAELDQRLKDRIKQYESTPRQSERSGLSQLFTRRKNPFTAPGPTAGGRRAYRLRRTRKLKRRS